MISKKGIAKIVGGFMLAASVAAASYFGGRAIYHFKNGYKDVHPLVDNKTIVQELEDNFDNLDNLYVLKDFPRMPKPVSQEIIKINITFQPEDRFKRAMEESVKEYNDIFAFINPIYKFELNYSPSKEDLKNPYDIDVIVESLAEIQKTEEGKGANAYNHRQIMNDSLKIDKDESYNSEIHMPVENFSNCKYFIHVFKHEIAHSFGLADIKNIDTKYATSSIMSYRADSQFTELQDNDIKLLYSLYRPIGEPYSQEKLDAYLDSHRGKFNYAVFAEKELPYCFSEKYIEELRSYVSILTYVDEEGKADILKAMEGETDIDRNFGNEQVTFVAAKKAALSNLFPTYYTLSDEGLRMQKFYNSKRGALDRDDTTISPVIHDGILDRYTEDGELLHYIKIGKLVLCFEDSTLKNLSNPEDGFLFMPTFFIETDQSYEEYKTECNDRLMKYYEDQEAKKVQEETEK